jgi:hypothetical protein
MVERLGGPLFDSRHSLNTKRYLAQILSVAIPASDVGTARGAPWGIEMQDLRFDG